MANLIRRLRAPRRTISSPLVSAQTRTVEVRVPALASVTANVSCHQPPRGTSTSADSVYADHSCATVLEWASEDRTRVGVDVTLGLGVTVHDHDVTAAQDTPLAITEPFTCKRRGDSNAGEGGVKQSDTTNNTRWRQRLKVAHKSQVPQLKASSNIKTVTVPTFI